MTNDKLVLFELIDQRADDDLVRDMLAFAADGGGGGRDERRARRRPQCGPDEPPERLPPTGLGDPGRPDRAGDSKAQGRAATFPRS